MASNITERDEKEFYPYYILFGYDCMPFKTSSDRQAANKAIREFCEIIELEKGKNESFAQKLSDIDFEVLFARPPGDKLRPNFDSTEENPEKNRELWKQWESRYAFPDQQKDVVDQAVSAKSRQKYF